MSVQRVEARPRKVRKVAIPVAVLLVLVFLGVAVTLRETPTGAYFQVADQVAMALLGVLLAGGALLLARPRMRADHTGVEVRGVITTRHYPWHRVRAIGFPDGAPWARLELPNDEYTPIMAIQATDGERAVTAMRELRELRRNLAAQQGSEPNTQPVAEDGVSPDAESREEDSGESVSSERSG